MLVGIGVDSIARHLAEVLVAQLVHGEARHSNVGGGSVGGGRGTFHHLIKLCVVRSVLAVWLI